MLAQQWLCNLSGRTQLTALVQTQKQQSRLEKVLTRQQSEIRRLQRAHDITKSGTHALTARSIVAIVYYHRIAVCARSCHQATAKIVETDQRRYFLHYYLPTCCMVHCYCSKELRICTDQSITCYPRICTTSDHGTGHREEKSESIRTSTTRRKLSSLTPISSVLSKHFKGAGESFTERHRCCTKHFSKDHPQCTHLDHCVSQCRVWISRECSGSSQSSTRPSGSSPGSWKRALRGSQKLNPE